MSFRIIYFLILNAFIVLFFNSCSTVQDAFDPQRKIAPKSFVEKSPLSMPPNFNELPVPQDTKNNNKDYIKDLILVGENDTDLSSDSSNINTGTDLEQSILDQINNN